MQRCMQVLLIGAVIMAAAILYAFVAGDFFAEAETMFPLPWFQLAMVDLYVGFLLFGGWILFREPSRPKAIGWILLVCVLGNLASCIYAVRAIVQCGGDWRRFWMGHQA